MDSPIKLTREELYDQVWTTPGRQLAPQFGLSDVGLAKICKKHRIPRPFPGYWARIQHGATIRRAPLPTLSDEALKTVVIQQHRFAQRDPDRRLPEIPVPDVLTNPHPLVVATERSLRGAKADEHGLVRPRAKETLKASIGPGSIDRGMRILDALLKAIEGRSGRVTHDGIEFVGENVPFALREDLVGQPREPTRKERWTKEHWPSQYVEPMAYSPSGKLSLTIEVPAGTGARLRWSDGKARRVEDHLTAFLETVIQLAEDKRKNRIEREERERRRAEWERQRGEKMRLIWEEEESLKRLIAAADSWARCRRLRAYIRHAVRTIEAAEGMRAQPGSSLEKWAVWATLHADRLDPAVRSPPWILDEKANPSILDEKAKWEKGYGPD